MVQTVQNAHDQSRTRAFAQRPFLTRAEVAATFGVSSSTVARWARAGRLPHILTLGGRRRFPRDKILELAAELAREAIPRTGQAGGPMGESWQGVPIRETG